MHSGERRTVSGDSWFPNASNVLEIGPSKVKVANESRVGEVRVGGLGGVGVRDHYFGISKNGKKRFPKRWTEARLQAKIGGHSRGSHGDF